MIRHRLAWPVPQHSATSELFHEHRRVNNLGLIAEEAVVAAKRLQTVRTRCEDCPRCSCLQLFHVGRGQFLIQVLVAGALGWIARAPLLGQYADWGAYTATPSGKKVCFVLAKPKSSKTEPAGRPRSQAYVFISTRPAENVRNEVSVMIGYPFKASSDATAEIGAARFEMYTQNDGAWIKNVAEEPRMVDVMRKGADLTVKGTSGRGTTSTDQYSLKGLAQALDKIEQECK